MCEDRGSDDEDLRQRRAYFHSSRVDAGIDGVLNLETATKRVLSRPLTVFTVTVSAASYRPVECKRISQEKRVQWLQAMPRFRSFLGSREK